MDKKKKLLEAILFLENNPITLTDLESMLGVSTLELSSILGQLEENLNLRDSVLELDYMEDKVYLRPKNQFMEFLTEVYGETEKKRLTRASLEVLSIIAWKQPVTRSEVEAVRGVDSTNAMRNLVSDEFVKVVGKKEVPGRPQTYGTTDKFLRYFGLSSLEELPKIEDMNEMFELSEKAKTNLD